MAEVELPNPEELHERGEDRFTRRVALVTAVFAFVLSISSLGGAVAAPGSRPDAAVLLIHFVTDPLRGTCTLTADSAISGSRLSASPSSSSVSCRSPA